MAEDKKTAAPPPPPPPKQDVKPVASAQVSTHSATGPTSHTMIIGNTRSSGTSGKN